MAKELTERNEEIKRLRFEEGKTLQEISELFGVSRERIRQIVPDTGSDFISKWTETKVSEFDLSKINNIHDLPGSVTVWRKLWGKYRHDAKSGTVKEGQHFEEVASSILYEMGFENTLMPNAHPFDILLKSGKKIDVKHSDYDVSCLESQGCVSPTYRISNMKYGKDCDFFFIFIPYKDQYVHFIVPSSEITTSDVRIIFPSMGRKPSKWTTYLYRFDLLNL
jgi:hypothetical protein